MKPFVYVAGPLTTGNVMHNTRTALQLGSRLIDLGYTPFVPHVTVMWDIVMPMEYEDWMEYDAEMVSRCDVLFRMEGESSGADREVAQARELGTPIVYSIVELNAWRTEDWD